MGSVRPDSRRHLLIAGESFEDLIFAGLPRLPRPGEEVRTRKYKRTWGGGALIAAAWARLEGAAVELWSALPPRITTILRNEGIRLVNVRRRGEPHAITACLSFGAERSFATFEGPNPVLEERFFKRMRQREGLDAGAALFAFRPRVCNWWKRWPEIAATGQHMRLPEVFWDFGYDERLPRTDHFDGLLRKATGVFVNAQEARLYNGRQRLLDRAAEAGTLVVVKLGADGAMIHGRPETLVPAPIPLHGVQDTTGAGDAFAAGFLACRLRGGALEEQLAAGNACGAESVSRLGGLPKRPWRPPAEDPGRGAS